MNLESIHSGNFDEEVLNSQQPILVEFGAVWQFSCGIQAVLSPLGLPFWFDVLRYVAIGHDVQPPMR